MKRLENKVAIVTGGATGIGEAISKKFAAEGASVLVVGMPQDPVKDVISDLKKSKAKAIGFSADISSEENAKEAIETAIKHFGRIDILINNAGVYPEANTIDEFSTEAFDNLLKNNLRTAFLMTKYAVPHLKKYRGCIVSAGSEAGKIGIPNVSPYGGTKGFMHAFMKGVAAEQAKNGIRVNCLAPGPIDTAWTHKEISDITKKMEKQMMSATPLGRRGTPEEIANVYLFLASNEASYITGAVYSVDGGITIGKGPVGDEVPSKLKKEPKGSLNLKHQMDGATNLR
ncbi:SDR family NAD(P)-dependent oxidoreductase [Salinimicrobium sediminilitoris]|uniref:SDR family NAD(P)-dependent oxidoreductase n=1 Tax=Salinimicrobium sediminilitoris TaxID=2876715 RepID=UPI001E4614E5|nr:SDR family oxidoreductase [Salinimicrobium sediminilitoris]MCC8358887.1 SDR family oxidoreductase [Salinimicrobium sediminilitoris]